VIDAYPTEIASGLVGLEVGVVAVVVVMVTEFVILKAMDLV